MWRTPRSPLPAPEPIHQACSRADIVLVRQRETGIDERSALVVARNTKSQRPLKREFCSAAEGVRKAGNVSFDFRTGAGRERAVNHGISRQGMHKNIGSVMVDQ